MSQDTSNLNGTHSQALTLVDAKILHQDYKKTTICWVGLQTLDNKDIDMYANRVYSIN
jgi:hypothetical protein